jgi:chaperonin GroEL
MLEGVAEIAKVVGATYGPKGRTVMLDRAAGLLSTKDGVAVAWELEPEDQLKRLGTRLVQEACDKVNKSVGDGTSTTAILIHAILVECHKWVAAGAHPSLLAQDLKRVAEGFDEARLFDMQRMDVEDEEMLVDVAMSASNGDQEIAEAIVEATNMVGMRGMVVVEEGKGRGVEIISKTGVEIDRGWESLDMSAPDGGPRQLDIPLVAVVDGQLTKLEDVRGILEEATQFPHPLVILSKGIYGEALKTLVMNDRKLERPDGVPFEVVGVRAPGHQDQMRAYLDDLAALTGATVIDPLTNPLKEFRSEFLGSAQSVLVKRRSSTFVAFEDKFDLIEARVEQLVREKETSSHSFDVEKLDERIAKLTDGFCVMRVGGNSNAEIRERRGRIEDALNAVRVAAEEGIVPGGGMAYMALSWVLGAGQKFTGLMESAGRPDLAVSGLGDRVMVKALEAPVRRLIANAGLEPSVVLEDVGKAYTERWPMMQRPIWSWLGWDARMGEVRDFREKPRVFDPHAVVREVVLTAISTASTLLTAEVAITKSEI